ncbi:recombinase family protein [Acutalibacter muris]|uniref:recombinase family protein n=1 Tax=Acutalibacter muris TaxID=1796620 RepID=UPI001C3EA025|nr:recombinase family protein [Acutalibacter muris]
MTIAKYLRISDEDRDLRTTGKDESDSVGNQRNLLDAYISQHDEFTGAEIVEFCDDGWSGKNFERPGVRDMLEQVRQGKIQCIIVKDDCVILELNSESPENTGLCDVSSVF